MVLQNFQKYTILHCKFVFTFSEFLQYYLLILIKNMFLHRKTTFLMFWLYSGIPHFCFYEKAPQAEKISAVLLKRRDFLNYPPDLFDQNPLEKVENKYDRA